MRLPFSLPIKKKELPEYYLALLLRDNKATAVIFEELHAKAHVIGEHEVFFENSVEDVSTNELLKSLDEAISKAESSLPRNVKTQKTIFGVKENWIEDGKIQKQYLQKLKVVCDSLELTPIGFLVITEAIAHLIQKEEGAPLSALIVEVGQKLITITVVKAGRVLETLTDERNEFTPVIQVDTMLQNISSVEVLPARIILIDSTGTSTIETLQRQKHIESFAQEFITHAWSKSLPFLHLPQITPMPKGFDAHAVLSGVAEQMGFELDRIDTLRSRQLQTSEDTNNQHTSRKTHEPTSTHESKQLEKLESDSFGFVKDHDIAAISDYTVQKEPLHHQIHPHHELQKAEEEHDGQIQESFPESKNNSQGPQVFQIFTPLFSIAVQIISSVFSNIPKMLNLKSIPFVSGRGSNKLLLIPAGIVIFVIMLFGLYMYLLKATVTIHITPKTIEKSQDITFAPDGESDFSKNVLAARAVSTDQKGSATTAATGKKEVGEKAKGTITIISSVTKEQTIPDGSKVTSSNGLVFILDNAVKIASSSGLTDLKNIQASVTASEIGKEYNLPSGAKFSIGAFDKSSMEGKNDSAFSGGSKKEITVVAKTDVDKLIKDLPKKLEGTAVEELKKNLSPDDILLPTSITTTLKDKKLDNDVGKEVKSVTLTSTVTFTSYVYKKNEVDEYAKKTLIDTQAHMKLSEKGISHKIESIKQNKDEEIAAHFVAQASFIPEVDEKGLQSELKGKPFDIAEDLLLKIPQVEDVTIQLHPSLSFLPKLLPQRSSNITISLDQK